MSEEQQGIKGGSDAHAALLGLRKATEADGDLVLDGWALDDPSMFGPTADGEFLMFVLLTRVEELAK